MVWQGDGVSCQQPSVYQVDYYTCKTRVLREGTGIRGRAFPEGETQSGEEQTANVYESRKTSKADFLYS